MLAPEHVLSSSTVFAQRGAETKQSPRCTLESLSPPDSRSNRCQQYNISPTFDLVFCIHQRGTAQPSWNDVSWNTGSPTYAPSAPAPTPPSEFHVVDRLSIPSQRDFSYQPSRSRVTRSRCSSCYDATLATAVTEIRCMYHLGVSVST